MTPTPQKQAPEKNQTQPSKQPQNPALRRPPAAGGPSRLPASPTAGFALPKKKMSKALKGFLIGGGITGAGIGGGLLFF